MHPRSLPAKMRRPAFRFETKHGHREDKIRRYWISRYTLMYEISKRGGGDIGLAKFMRTAGNRHDVIWRVMNDIQPGADGPPEKSKHIKNAEHRVAIMVPLTLGRRLDGSYPSDNEVDDLLGYPKGTTYSYRYQYPELWRKYETALADSVQNLLKLRVLDAQQQAISLLGPMMMVQFELATSSESDSVRQRAAAKVLDMATSALGELSLDEREEAKTAITRRLKEAGYDVDAELERLMAQEESDTAEEAQAQ